jgi:pimeloyl-ACP methyl ester carboxylesterase
MSDFVERMKADHDGSQGPNAWKTLLGSIFGALTTCPNTFEDLRKISAPTLILTGDRDMTCSAEEAVQAFRMLPHGELAILPNQGHLLPQSAVDASIDFLARHAAKK